MRARIYLRIAKTSTGGRGGSKGFRVAATSKPSHRPIEASVGEPLPTAAFAIDLVIPDEMFTEAERVIAELTVDPADLEVAAEVVEA